MNKLTLVIALVLALFFVSHDTVSQSLHNYSQEGDSVETMRKAARLGIATQQYNLAYTLYTKVATDEAKKEALDWLSKLESTKSAAVRYKMGALYQTGEIFSRDIEKAFNHFKYSAENGDPYAQANVGSMYLNGIFVKQDVEEGIAWTKKAAKMNLLHAQLNLGLLYLSDALGKKDVKQARHWLEAATQHDSDRANYELGKTYLLEKNFTKAFDYFDRATELGNSNAMVMQAMMFEQGLATEKSREKADKLLMRAAELGNKRAIKILKSAVVSKKKAD